MGPPPSSFCGPGENLLDGERSVIQSDLVNAMEPAMLSVPVGVMSFFAVVWLTIGLAVAGQVSLLPIGAGVALSAALLWTAIRGDRAYTGPALPPAQLKRMNQLVAWSSATQGVAILIAVNVLINLGLPQYQICAVAVIVGLHFLPLARMPFTRGYYVTAAAMAGLGLLGCVLTESVRPLVVGPGCAVVLWLTCAWALRGRRRVVAAMA